MADDRGMRGSIREIMGEENRVNCRAGGSGWIAAESWMVAAEKEEQ